jgi:hypothetical protein
MEGGQGMESLYYLAPRRPWTTTFYKYVSNFCSSILSTVSSKFSISYSKFMECSYAFL